MKKRLPIQLLLSLSLVACQSGPRVAGDLDPRDMDPGADPAADFYRYANGGWLDRTDIPAEEAAWSLASEIDEHNQELLHGILVDASKDDEPEGLRRKLGDFWASGMDTERIDELGASPLDGELGRIAGVGDGESLARCLARLHALGVGAMFGFGFDAGLQESIVQAWATQGGLGLPSRDYYFDEDKASIREAYVAHVARMFELLGDAPETALANARSVLELEVRLAKDSLSNVELRNPQNFDRKIPFAEAKEAMPHFAWDAYLDEAGTGAIEELNQPMPGFFAELDRMLGDVELSDWKTYLRWHLVNSFADVLASDFEEQNFDFYSRTLTGTEEMEPRWKRVLGATNAVMGEALGEIYVEKAFSPRAKARAKEMVSHLLDVMGDRIRRLEWMGPETRERALEKLAAFDVKLGYPDEWRDYSKLEIERDSFAANVMRARLHDHAWELSKLGKPVDPNEWGMTPQTLNAYYHPLHNEIVFPAAILQPPFFSEEVDDPLNYGAIGAVIGHEITHGFDDSGSQFDAEGRLQNWWTDEDRAEFESRAQKLVEQYSGYEALPGVPVNGQLTLGENIADVGGLLVALEAMQRANEGIPDPMIAGFSREQRFFLAFARVWRKKERDAYLKNQVATDPHSPARFRVKGTLANVAAFGEAFDLSKGAPMLLPAGARASIW